jgi:hypothetical protein
MEEKWEIDPLEMTLNDLELLQKGFGPGSDISKLKDILGRMVTNKTAEEIGALTLRQLNEFMEAAMKEVEEMAVPKATGTP